MSAVAALDESFFRVRFDRLTPSDDTTFTLPLFDEFMRRTIPGQDWRS